MRFERLRVLIYLMAWCCLTSTGCGPPAAPCLDCSVILISVDTMRRDRLGIYGYAKDTTPKIDAFFADGTRFVRAITPSPCTNPAVLQVLTGSRTFPKNAPRLAERLKSAGYATAAVVSQHVFGSRKAPKPQYARGFEYFDIQETSRRDHHNLTARTAAEVTDRALDWLEHKRTASKFFLWVHYFDPHDPYEAPDTHRVFGGGEVPGLTGDRRTLLKEAFAKHGRQWVRDGNLFGARDVEFLSALYDAEINYVDTQVGRLLAEVRRLGIAKSSAVILWSDHGERLGEENWWDHCSSLHWSEVNVPMLFSVRGGPLGGHSQVEETSSTLDIAPTVLGMLGLESAGFEGADLSRPLSPRRIKVSYRGERAVYSGDWKLYYRSDAERRLLDLVNDPFEEHDRALERPEVVEELALELLTQKERDAEVQKRTDAAREELRSLGYLESVGE